MSKTIRVLLGMFLVCGVMMFAGCSSDDNSANSVDSATYLHIPFPDASYFARVRSITATVTAADITTPISVSDTTIHGTTQTDLALTVPSGTARHFDIIASDSLGQNLYRTQFDATVNSGARTDLSATLFAIGFGNPTKVKIFRDDFPWHWLPVGPQPDSVLMNVGFTQGAGANQFQVLTSSLMGSVTLTPGVDLVIIEADQETTFYQNYMAARASFDNFVEQGGQLFFISALQSSVASRVAVLFPDSVIHVMQMGTNNYTEMADHPINIGQAEVMAGSAASHGCFTNLSPGSLVLNTNVYDSAVTVIYSYGKGTVILSGQTLEFSRAYRNTYPTVGPILSKTIRFLLGLDPTPDPHPRTGNPPIAERSSSDMN